jgi:uncharacterized protein
LEAAAPPRFAPDPTTDFFFDSAKVGELRILRCQACGLYIHAPRPICKRCLSFDLAPERVSGKATLYSYTQTFKAFHPYFVDKVPYLVATVTLAEQEGLQLVTNLVEVDESDVHIGMALEVCFVDQGGSPIPVFRPASSTGASA